MEILVSILFEVSTDIKSGLYISFLYLFDMAIFLDIEKGAKKSGGKKCSNQENNTNFVVNTHGWPMVREGAYILCHVLF